MSEKRVSTRYARAVYNTAQQEKLEETVLNDFTYITRIINSSKELKAVLKSPVIQYWRKKDIFKEIFSNDINPLTLNFINLVTTKNREDLLIDIFIEYSKIYNLEKGILVVNIDTAVEIDDNTKNSIEAKIKSMTNKDIITHYGLKPELKGGMTVQIDDWVYDNSVATQLNQLYNKLKDGN